MIGMTGEGKLAWQSERADNGVSSAGLIRTVHPAARAGRGGGGGGTCLAE